MKQKVCIFAGRFQPITQAHKKCIDTIWYDYKVPVVLCIIGSHKKDERHPIPGEILKSLYEDMFKDSRKVIEVATFPVADFVKIQKYFKDKYEIQYIVCGEDRYDLYKQMVDKYMPDVKLIKIDRDDDISATKLRKTIKNGDFKGFKELFMENDGNIFVKWHEGIGISYKTLYNILKYFINS